MSRCLTVPPQAVTRAEGGMSVGFEIRGWLHCSCHCGCSRAQQNLFSPAFVSVLNIPPQENGAFFIYSAYVNLQHEFNYSSLDIHLYFPQRSGITSELVLFVYFWC